MGLTTWLKPISAPIAHGCITLLGRHSSGYISHPAVLDANLHLAAAILKPDEAFVLRIPASVGLINSESAVQGFLHPVAIQGGMKADSVICGFRLSNPQNKASGQIVDMVAKELPVASRPVEEQVADYLYEAEMQVSNSVSKQSAAQWGTILSLQRKFARPALSPLDNLSAFKSGLASTSIRGGLQITDASKIRPQLAAIRFGFSLWSHHFDCPCLTLPQDSSLGSQASCTWSNSQKRILILGFRVMSTINSMSTGLRAEFPS